MSKNTKNDKISADDEFLKAENEMIFSQRIRMNYNKRFLGLIMANYLNDGFLILRMLSLRTILFDDYHLPPD